MGTHVNEFLGVEDSGPEQSDTDTVLRCYKEMDADKAVDLYALSLNRRVFDDTAEVLTDCAELCEDVSKGPFCQGFEWQEESSAGAGDHQCSLFFQPIDADQLLRPRSSRAKRLFARLTDSACQDVSDPEACANTADLCVTPACDQVGRQHVLLRPAGGVACCDLYYCDGGEGTLNPNPNPNGTGLGCMGLWEEALGAFSSSKAAEVRAGCGSAPETLCSGECRAIVVGIWAKIGRAGGCQCEVEACDPFKAAIAACGAEAAGEEEGASSESGDETMPDESAPESESESESEAEAESATESEAEAETKSEESGEESIVVDLVRIVTPDGQCMSHGGYFMRARACTDGADASLAWEITASGLLKRPSDGRCADVAGDEPFKNWASVRARACTGADSHVWSLDAEARLASHRGDERCAVVSSDSTIKVYDCASARAGLRGWQMVEAPESATYSDVARVFADALPHMTTASLAVAGGLCLDGSGFFARARACEGDAAGATSFHITSAGMIVRPDGRCLEVRGASARNWASLIFISCSGQAHQKFEITDDGQIKPHHASGQCLVVASGRQIKTFECGVREDAIFDVRVLA